MRQCVLCNPTAPTCPTCRPARVVKKNSSDSWTVAYDNDEQERVKTEHLYPFEAPVEFGAELTPIEVGRRQGSPAHAHTRLPASENGKFAFISSVWPEGWPREGLDGLVDNASDPYARAWRELRAACPMPSHVDVLMPQLGEFVEVSNGSQTDPCAWVGVVATFRGSNYVVRAACACQTRA